MRKVLLIIAIFLLLGLASDYNVTTERVLITDGTEVLDFYLESDTAYIRSTVPLIFIVPNLIDIEKQLNDMQEQINRQQEQIDSLELSSNFRNGLYYIRDTLI